MASKKQIKRVAQNPQSPRHKAAKKRLEANSPQNRSLRQAERIHKEGNFRWK